MFGKKNQLFTLQCTEIRIDEFQTVLQERIESVVVDDEHSQHHRQLVLQRVDLDTLASPPTEIYARYKNRSKGS